MSLIPDQQRKKSQVSQPEIKPVQSVAQTEETPMPDPTLDSKDLRGLQEPQTSRMPTRVVEFTPEGTTDTEQQQETIPEQQPESENTSPFASLVKAVGLEASENGTSGTNAIAQDANAITSQQPVPEFTEPSSVRPQLPQLPEIQPIFDEIKPLSPYDPLVVLQKLPTVYFTQPDFVGMQSQGQALVNRTYDRYNQEQQRQLEQATKLQQQLQERGRAPNQSDIDKPWFGTNANLAWANDILFGNEQAQKRTEQGNYNPLAGEFGRQGAGLGGLVKYVLSTGANVVYGAAAETRKATANGLQALGVPREAAEKFTSDGFVGLLPESIRIPFTGGSGGVAYDDNGNLVRTDKTPDAELKLGALRASNYIGFNWDEARKRNSIFDAILGDEVADINDPKASTELGTGRVFYSPSREIGEAWYDDPVSAALQIGTALFNPGDIPVENVISAGVRKLFGRVAKKTPDVIKNTPELPQAATPTKVVRVPQGETTVIQTQLPPAIEPQLVPPKAQPLLPTSNPALTAVEIGIGKPSELPITDLGALEIRPYSQMIQQIQLTNPKLLEGYTGNSWQELKIHLSKQPSVNLQEFAVVGQKLTPTAEELTEAIRQIDKQANEAIETLKKQATTETTPQQLTEQVQAIRRQAEADKLAIKQAVSSPTTEDLLEATEELASQKLTIEAPMRQLEDYFDTSVDFGRRPLQDLGTRPTTADEIAEVLGNGGKPNLHPDVAKLLPDVGRIAAEGDYDALVKLSNSSGKPLQEMFDELAKVNNDIVSLPLPVNRIIRPAQALTNLPSQLYHGTAIEGWTPKYNLSENGSRGELGYGLYLTKDTSVAEDYAKATVSQNASPATLDRNLNPSIHNISSTLETTLDARAKLPSNAQVWQELMFGLPEQLTRAMKKSMSRAKTATYNSFLNKLESSMVKAGVDPTEETLQQMQKTVSNNLRRLGYDSVYDSKSGFAMVLDEARVASTSVKSVTKAEDVGQAALARYNADAYAAKFYPERLTSDANLRDSSYQLLDHLRSKVDSRMSDLQQEVMKRLGSKDVSGVLEPIASVNEGKPKSLAELFYELPDENICNL